MPRKTTQATPSTKSKRSLQGANARDTAINELLNILTAKSENNLFDSDFASDTVNYKYSADERLKAAELILKYTADKSPLPDSH